MDWDQIAIMTVVPSFICVFGSLFFFLKIIAIVIHFRELPTVALA